MKFFNRKNYDEDIKNLQERLNEVENENKGLKSNVGKILEILLKKERKEYDLSTEYLEPNKTIPRGKDTKKRKVAKRGSHITQIANFKANSKPRGYDPHKDIFYSTKKDGSKIKIELSFNELVEIIKGHQKGFGGGYLSKYNKVLSHFSAGSINNYLYIYRAGGFNDAIKRYAPEKGYNPKKLISNEVKKNEV